MAIFLKWPHSSSRNSVADPATSPTHQSAVHMHIYTLAVMPGGGGTDVTAAKHEQHHQGFCKNK